MKIIYISRFFVIYINIIDMFNGGYWKFVIVLLICDKVDV